MKFLAATDLHMASKAPENRIDADFPEELFELLEQLRQAAQAIQAQAILFPGDLFHDTAHTRVSMEVLARFAAWCFAVKRGGTEVLGIAGNHDLKFNRYDSLPNTPLGLLFQIRAMHNVADDPIYFPVGEETVEVRGVPYPAAFDLENWRVPVALGPRADQGSWQSIVLGHCFANRTAGNYFGDPVHAYGELLLASDADYIVLGHDHTDRGVHRFRTEYGKVCYVLDQGAMMRGSLSDNDINRDLKFALIDTTKREVKEYRYLYRPAEAILNLEKVERRREERQHIETFVSRLHADLAAQTATTTVEEKLGAMTLPAEVRERVLDYIAQAEHAQEAT